MNGMVISTFLGIAFVGALTAAGVAYYDPRVTARWGAGIEIKDKFNRNMTAIEAYRRSGGDLAALTDTNVLTAFGGDVSSLGRRAVDDGWMVAPDASAGYYQLCFGVSAGLGPTEAPVIRLAAQKALASLGAGASEQTLACGTTSAPWANVYAFRFRGDA